MTDPAPTAAEETAAPTFSSQNTRAELACGVCSEYALTEGIVHESAGHFGTRLMCQVCGAHRVP